MKTFDELCEYVERKNKNIIIDKFQTMKGLVEQFNESFYYDDVKKITVMVEDKALAGLTNMVMETYYVNKHGIIINIKKSQRGKDNDR